jgi:amino acid transporter
MLKSMSWWDGFVVALANPGFLIAALGYSIGALGTGGAIILWTISVLVGALQNNIYAEMATMFPEKSGGLAIYAHEAFRKYTNFVGPVVAFGYWMGWTVVLSINGLVVGTLIVAKWFPAQLPGTDGAWSVGIDPTAVEKVAFGLSVPVLIGVAAIVIVWIFNILGVRPAVWFGYVTGALLLIPAFVLMFLPYLTGNWDQANLKVLIGENGGLALAIGFLYLMCWSSYGFEAVASFAPEYHDTAVDTPLALRVSAMFSIVVYVLLPLGLGGTLSTATVSDNLIGGVSFYVQAFDKLVGAGAANFMIFCLIAGLVLSMNTATMDGSRALFGIAKEGMTIKQLGKLSKRNVPSLAMTIDAVANILLLVFFHGVIAILAVSNVGYVLATVCALFGFVLLRKDRPDWPRPIKLGKIWVVIGAVLATWNLALLVLGGFVLANQNEAFTLYNLNKTLIGCAVLVLAFLLYVYRHVVQDKTGIRFRDETPPTPHIEVPIPEAP